MQLKHTGGAALVILSGEESIQAVGLAPYPEGSQRSTAAALGPNTPALAARSAGPALLAEAETGPVQADATLAETETQQLGRSMSPSAGTGEQLQDAALEKEDGQEVEEAPVFVSLADFPAGPPWRPLAHRADVMALRGLQHLSGARLAKAVRDLRELEGRYIIKDKDRWGLSTSCCCQVGPGCNKSLGAQQQEDSVVKACSTAVIRGLSDTLLVGCAGAHH